MILRKTNTKCHSNIKLFIKHENCLSPLWGHRLTSGVLVGSVLLIFLVSCVVSFFVVFLLFFFCCVCFLYYSSCFVFLYLSSSCVLCAQCCQCPWISHSLLSLRYSLTFVYVHDISRGCYWAVFIGYQFVTKHICSPLYNYFLFKKNWVVYILIKQSMETLNDKH